MEFFVNGMHSEPDAAGERTMRFLAQFSCAGTVEVAVTRAEADTQPRAVAEARVDVGAGGPEVIRVVVGAVDDAAVARYAYEAVFRRESGEEERVTGAFALVGSRATPVKLAFVSCNDNGAVLGAYRARGEAGSEAWARIAEETPDVIVHCGDQVYADDVYAAWDGDRARAAAMLRELYTATYAEPTQARAMRHALNFAILDDHEVADGYGVARVDPEYAACALDAYCAYQCALRDDDDGATARDDFSYAQRVGAHVVVALDERSTLVRSGVALDARSVAFVERALREASAAAAPVIVVSPRPLAFVDPIASGACALVAGDGRDALMHPKNCAGAWRVRRAVLEHVRAGHRACVVSGDVHCAYAQTHADGDGASFEELVTSGVTRAPLETEAWWVRLAASAALAAFEWTGRLCGVARRTAVHRGASYGVYDGASGTVAVRAVVGRGA